MNNVCLKNSYEFIHIYYLSAFICVYLCIPVSYTHLDVYKRQGYKSSMIDRLLKRHLYKTRSHHNTIDDNKVNNNKKYITTVYGSLLPNIICNVFSKFNIKVAFKQII